jgi:hypothetical protein
MDRVVSHFAGDGVKRSGGKARRADPAVNREGEVAAVATQQALGQQKRRETAARNG